MDKAGFCVKQHLKLYLGMGVWIYWYAGGVTVLLQTKTAGKTRHWDLATKMDLMCMLLCSTMDIEMNCKRHIKLWEPHIP